MEENFELLFTYTTKSPKHQTKEYFCNELKRLIIKPSIPEEIFSIYLYFILFFNLFLLICIFLNLFKCIFNYIHFFQFQSLLYSKGNYPWIFPIPVMIPAAGTGSSYISCAASWLSSRNDVPGSRSRFILSLTRSLPLDRWFFLAASLPPFTISFIVDFNVSTKDSICCSFSWKLFTFFWSFLILKMYWRVKDVHKSIFSGFGDNMKHE